VEGRHVLLGLLGRFTTFDQIDTPIEGLRSIRSDSFFISTYRRPPYFLLGFGASLLGVLGYLSTG
jgi:hypothetical protein